jgi:hypothetical protein
MDLFDTCTWADFIVETTFLDIPTIHFPPCKNSWKKSKTSHLGRSDHTEGDVMQNHDQKKEVKKSEKPRFYGQNKLLS